MSKETYTGKVWLLKSNQERIFDSFDPSQGLGSGISKSEKVLLYTIEETGRQMPTEQYPVAIVHEHLNKGGHYPKEGLRSTYAVPLLGHDLLQQLEGRLLDYVDATYADIEQRKAQKKIMRRILWEFREQAISTNQTKFDRAPQVSADGTAEKSE
jgi:hypothetical protein